MVISSVAEADQHAPFVVDSSRRSGFSAIRPFATASWKALSRILTQLYGPAVRCKRFRRPGWCGLALLYPASDWSVCSGPSWISARMRP